MKQKLNMARALRELPPARNELAAAWLEILNLMIFILIMALSA